MRVAFRLDLIGRAPYIAICAALAFSTLPMAASAQTAQAAPAQSATLAESNDTASGASANAQPAALAATDGDSQVAASATTARDDAASVNGISLDDQVLSDQVLSRQRGGAVGMLMMAATPQLMQGGGNRVTLWDEIAPPAPLPIPVDAARAAQGNVATYQRK
jgi:hypothetical protein